MSGLIENLSVIWDRLVALFSSYNIITDTLDIALVAFLIYSAIKMLKETRGIQICRRAHIFSKPCSVISF